MGQYEVISREDKHFTIKIEEKEVAVSTDCLKLAYIINDTLPEDNNETLYQIVVQVADQQQHPFIKKTVQIIVKEYYLKKFIIYLDLDIEFEKYIFSTHQFSYLPKFAIK